MPGGGGVEGAGKNKGEGVTPILGQSQVGGGGGGHEEIDIQEGGCLILQFCFILKKCVHCCQQY